MIVQVLNSWLTPLKLNMTRITLGHSGHLSIRKSTQSWIAGIFSRHGDMLTVLAVLLGGGLYPSIVGADAAEVSDLTVPFDARVAQTQTKHLYGVNNAFQAGHFQPQLLENRASQLNTLSDTDPTPAKHQDFDGPRTRVSSVSSVSFRDAGKTDEPIQTSAPLSSSASLSPQADPSSQFLAKSHACPVPAKDSPGDMYAGASGARERSIPSVSSDAHVLPVIQQPVRPMWSEAGIHPLLIQERRLYGLQQQYARMVWSSGKLTAGKTVAHMQGLIQRLRDLGYWPPHVCKGRDQVCASVNLCICHRPGTCIGHREGALCTRQRLWGLCQACQNQLRQALKDCQRHHGLSPTGQLDQATLQVLNVALAHRKAWIDHAIAACQQAIDWAVKQGDITPAQRELSQKNLRSGMSSRDAGALSAACPTFLCSHTPLSSDEIFHHKPQPCPKVFATTVQSACPIGIGTPSVLSTGTQDLLDKRLQEFLSFDDERQAKSVFWGILPWSDTSLFLMQEVENKDFKVAFDASIQAKTIAHLWSCPQLALWFFGTGLDQDFKNKWAVMGPVSLGISSGFHHPLFQISPVADESRGVSYQQDTYQSASKDFWPQSPSAGSPIDTVPAAPVTQPHVPSLATPSGGDCDLSCRACARSLVVNIPSYMVYGFQHMPETLQAPMVFASKVIVGQPKNPTPVLGARVCQLVTHPVWYMPTCVKRKMMAEGKPLTGEGKRGPGPDNPLGRVKFLLDGSAADQSILLHSTNQPKLFDKRRRALSLGCVRVQDEEDMMSFILSDPSACEKVQHHWETKRTATHAVVPKVPTYLVYLLVWVDDKGMAWFFPDVYARAPIPARQGWQPVWSSGGQNKAG